MICSNRRGSDPWPVGCWSFESFHWSVPSGARVVPRAQRFQRRPYAIEQVIFVERLGQEFDRTGPQRLHPHRCIVVGGDEDDWNLDLIGVQLRLQIEAGHPRHADVRDQARHVMLLAGAQKFFSRRKRARMQTDRLQQILHGASHRRVVIDDGDECSRNSAQCP